MEIFCPLFITSKSIVQLQYVFFMIEIVIRGQPLAYLDSNLKYYRNTRRNTFVLQCLLANQWK
jgi:hypothetical protein